MAVLFASAALAGFPAAYASEADAILQALVKKGVLSEKEAAKIQDDAAQQTEQSSANKIKLSNSLTELRLYGDVRVRYQHDNIDFQVNPKVAANHHSEGGPSGTQKDRLRLRLRLDADFKLTDNWFGGVQLQTGYAADTGNQTIENGFSNYPVFISRAYLGNSPTDWLTFVAGKLPNPFYTTELTWDPDINPTGFTEQIAFHKLFGSHESAGGLGKDGKAAIAPAAASPWELTLNAGQLLFDDNLEGGGKDPGTTDHDTNSDAWLFETQLVATYKFNEHTHVTIAPGWMVYTASNVSVPSSLTSTFGDFNLISFSDSAKVSGATRNLSIIDAPGDITFQIGKIPARIYWDVAFNLDGNKRFNDTYRLGHPVVGDATTGLNHHHTQDDLAWLAGFQLGENRKKGDLSLLANWRELGVSALDPNLTDNEFGLGYQNMRGFRVGLSYNLSDAAVFSLNYFGAWNIDRTLIGGEATGGNSIANANATQNLQVDLNVKF